MLMMEHSSNQKKLNQSRMEKWLNQDRIQTEAEYTLRDAILMEIENVRRWKLRTALNQDEIRMNVMFNNQKTSNGTGISRYRINIINIRIHNNEWM